jgi:hypothetical protein
VSVRRHGEGDTGSEAVEAFAARVAQVTRERSA